MSSKYFHPNIFKIFSSKYLQNIFNKGPAVELKSFDPQTKELLEGEEAAREFTDKRHQGGAKLNDVDI